jgi:uncharacterized lipoprotein
MRSVAVLFVITLAACSPDAEMTGSTNPPLTLPSKSERTPYPSPSDVLNKQNTARFEASAVTFRRYLLTAQFGGF